MVRKIGVKRSPENIREVIAVEALNVSSKERWVTENDKMENDLDSKTKEYLLEEARSFLFSVTLVIKIVFRIIIKGCLLCLGHNAKEPIVITAIIFFR